MKYYYEVSEELLYDDKSYGIRIYKAGNQVEYISDVCCEEDAARELCDRLNGEDFDPTQIYDVIEDLLSVLYDL